MDTGPMWTRNCDLILADGVSAVFIAVQREKARESQRQREKEKESARRDAPLRSPSLGVVRA